MALIMAVVLITPAGAAKTDCREPSGKARSVARVLDGETVVLGGGTELRLTGALAPRAFDSATEASIWPPADLARATLESLLLGRTITIRPPSGRATDRYGRLLAQAFVAAPDDRMLWVQEEMVRRGAARAYAPVGEEHCLAALIEAENTARAGKVGLWREAAYAVRPASDIPTLLRLEGTFQIVEGRVHQVSPRRTLVYVNFDQDWRRDFTILARGRALRAIQAEGLDLAKLQGRRVRVRGWIMRRGGPMIEIGHAAEVELLDHATVDGSR
ncbi:MAG: thermonuclease family protein [Hyphomicrobiaceae bacterium]